GGGGASAKKPAESREPPIGSDLTHEIPCQDRVVADVVDFIQAIRPMAQNHVGGGASRWRRIRFYHRHQVPTEDVHVDEIERRDLVYDAGVFEKIERVGAGRVPTRYKLDPILGRQPPNQCSNNNKNGIHYRSRNMRDRHWWFAALPAPHTGTSP